MFAASQTPVEHESNQLGHKLHVAGDDDDERDYSYTCFRVWAQRSHKDRLNFNSGT